MFCSSQLTSYESGGEMLFDHQKDPHEDRNVAGNPEYREPLAAMKKLLVERRREAEHGEPK